MNRYLLRKRLVIGAAIIGASSALSGALWTNLAFAQTPVSTSVHISGSCVQCDMSHRVMPRISLQGSNFAGSDFSHSNLSGGKFHRTNFSGASFHKAYLLRVEGEEVNLTKAVLRDATLSEAVLKSSDISSADLKRADLSGGDFSNTNFSNSNLKSIDAMNTVFTGANFTGANLKHGTFTDADFSNANLTDTNFGNAVFDNAVLRGAILNNAKLAAVTGLTQEQISGACGDEDTELPKNMSISACPAQQAVAAAAQATPTPIARFPLMSEQSAYAPPVFGPNAQSRIRQLYIQSVSVQKPQSPKQQALGQVMLEIEAAMRELPVNSSARARLSKSRDILEKIRANDD